jgi:hypothetical protein
MEHRGLQQTIPQPRLSRVQAGWKDSQTVVNDWEQDAYLSIDLFALDGQDGRIDAALDAEPLAVGEELARERTRTTSSTINVPYTNTLWGLPAAGAGGGDATWMWGRWGRVPGGRGAAQEEDDR